MRYFNSHLTTHAFCFDREVESSVGLHINVLQTVAYPGILFGGGGSKNSVEDRENGYLGAVAP